MKYDPNKVDAVFIHDDNEWCIIKLMGSWTLCYPKFDKRTAKPSVNALGIAFPNADMMRTVAHALISRANAEDAIKKIQSKG